ncbi:MAG TPA: hypothetical protein VJV04_11230 [Nitrospiraceae bacterium]|nr:hypothetical protein [Nitrospiraceae bacterium]
MATRKKNKPVKQAKAKRSSAKPAKKKSGSAKRSTAKHASPKKKAAAKKATPKKSTKKTAKTTAKKVQPKARKKKTTSAKGKRPADRPVKAVHSTESEEGTRPIHREMMEDEPEIRRRPPAEPVELGEEIEDELGDGMPLDDDEEPEADFLDKPEDLAHDEDTD